MFSPFGDNNKLIKIIQTANLYKTLKKMISYVKEFSKNIQKLIILERN